MSLILDALKKSEAERQRGQAPNLMSPLPSRSGPGHAGKKSNVPWIVLTVFLSTALIVSFFFMKSGMSESTGPSSMPSTPSMQAEMKPETPSPPITIATSTAVTPPIAPVTEPSFQTPEVKPISPIVAPSESGSTATAVIETMPENRLTSIADMPVDQRQQLPALKLSMHVYSSEATKRFAIIDGQRVNEGSILGTAVVDEIRQDGVVLSVQGQSYLLPRP